MADAQAGSPKTSRKTLRRTTRQTSRRRKPLLSIRGRLIVVALLAIAPLMFERVRGLERTRAERTELAHARVADLARGGAEAQREVVYSMRALLQVVARIYAKMPLDPADCNRTLTELTGNVPWLRDMNVVGMDGRIKCATDPHALGLNVSDRPYFQSALHSHDFALSDYLIMPGQPGTRADGDLPHCQGRRLTRRRRPGGAQSALDRRPRREIRRAFRHLGRIDRRRRHADRGVRRPEPHSSARTSQAVRSRTTCWPTMKET